MSAITTNLETMELLCGAKFLHAYLECSNEIQAGIRDLIAILNDPETDDGDLQMTIHTLAQALFPKPYKGRLGVDLEESESMGAQHSEEVRDDLQALDREEASFAERLAHFMNERHMTQQELADKAGVGQPAICNMLNRKCRPQRRTVQRFAEILGVPPGDLWPNS